jgi:hypothetical protein
MVVGRPAPGGRFVRKKPNTNVALAAIGRERIADHWAQLERPRQLSEPD